MQSGSMGIAHRIDNMFRVLVMTSAYLLLAMACSECIAFADSLTLVRHL